MERRDAAERRGGGRVRHDPVRRLLRHHVDEGGKKWAYGLSMAAILLAQAAVYGMTTDLQLLKLLYPLVTHMPLVLVLAILERKLLWPTISVLTAYLCCQLRRWLALLLTALMSGGAEVQTAAELALTLPLLLGCCTLWRLPCGQSRAISPPCRCALA